MAGIEPVEGQLPRVAMSSLRLGTLLELAARLWIRTVGWMVLGVLTILVPGFVIFAYAVRFFDDHVLIHMSLFVAIFVEFVIIELFFIFIFGLAFALCVKIASESMFGSVSLLGALARVLSRAASLAWVFVLLAMIEFAVSLPVAFLSRWSHTTLLIGVLVLLIFDVWFAVATSFVVPAVVLHNARGMKAIGRSFSVVSRNWFFCFVVYLLVGVLYLALVSVLEVAFDTYIPFSLYDPLAPFYVTSVLVLIALPVVVYMPVQGCVNFLLYAHLTMLTDNRRDAEEMGWEMRARPSRRGLVFRLADSMPAASGDGPLGPQGLYGPATGPMAGPPPYGSSPGGGAVAAPEGYEVPLPAFRPGEAQGPTGAPPADEPPPLPPFYG